MPEIADHKKQDREGLQGVVAHEKLTAEPRQ